MAYSREPRSDLSPRKVAEHLKEEGKERLERGKATAANQVDQVASALKSAGNELGEQSAVGNYANQFAGSISNLGRRLRDSRIEDLASDMQGAARRNPAMFLLGGLALGIVLARLVKASTPEHEQDGDDSTTGDEVSAISSALPANDEIGSSYPSSVDSLANNQTGADEPKSARSSGELDGL